MIPHDRRAAVQAALQEVFGQRPIGAMSAISGGVSGAAILRFEVEERPYLLRIEPGRIRLADRQRGFEAMVAAAEADVAPAVRHADAAAGVAIMDLIPSHPLAEHPGGAAWIVREMGDLVARVQATAPFPRLGDYPQMIAASLEALSGSGQFAAGALAEHRAGLARLTAAYRWDASALVSSHNDPNPRNILFDGRRLWLIDWELAFRNDPLADLAIIATEFARSPGHEDALLAAGLGRAPDQTARDRLAAMKLFTRLFYGGVVLGNFTEPPAPDIPALTPEGFNAAVAEGRLGSGTPETAYAFGLMSLRAFVDGMATPGFEAVLDRLHRG